jgi:hypothetical protein
MHWIMKIQLAIQAFEDKKISEGQCQLAIAKEVVDGDCPFRFFKMNDTISQTNEQATL